MRLLCRVNEEKTADRSPGDATDAESGEDSTDRKERDGGRSGLHRHTGAEDEQVGADAESATEPSTDVATCDRAAEALSANVQNVSVEVPLPGKGLGAKRLTFPLRGSR